MPPLTDFLFLLYGRRAGESTRCFRRQKLSYFFTTAYIVLYCRKRLGHHLGTKASKIIVLLYASMYKKVSTYNGFHSSRLFDSKKQILFFIKISKTAAQSLIFVYAQLFCYAYRFYFMSSLIISFISGSFFSISATSAS